jgi:CPA2 family monovalent cation:H+ antiporter-2
VIVFGLAVVILLICHRLGIPLIIGLLLTGVIAGPHGLAFVRAAEDVEILAEIGVVLLMFTIGVEFSLRKLFEIRREVMLGGLMQVGLTTGVAFAIAHVTGMKSGPALFLGFLLALSSTAIVLKILNERSEVESPHGKTVLAYLIFQDIAIVPMIIITPFLAGGGETSMGALALLIGKAVAVVGLSLLSARTIVPWLLYQIANTRSRELFVLSVVVICFAVAWLTASAGLSLGLGAFLAGLIISESEYSHQAIGGILPFHDVFTSIFFVSIGMLLDFRVILENPLLITVIVLGVLALKSVLGGLVTLILRMPLRTAIITGIAISQIGEFSFVLARTGIEHGLLADNHYQVFLGVAVLTMAATPFMISFAPKLADLVARLPLPDWLQGTPAPPQGAINETLTAHLVIIGFGVSGKNLARAARFSGIPYVAIETNPRTVEKERARGRPLFYGDATYEAVLKHAHVEEARVVVIVINDPIATRSVIQMVRHMSPHAHIIVRTRYLREVEQLVQLGADRIIPEEFETSVEIFTQVLAEYHIPREEVERLIAEVRGDTYEMFRTMPEHGHMVPGLEDSSLRVHSVHVQEDAPIAGKTLAELELRQTYDVTLVEIRRTNEILSNPAGDLQILAGDQMLLLGDPERIAEFERMAGKEG